MFDDFAQRTEDEEDGIVFRASIKSKSIKKHFALSAFHLERGFYHTRLTSLILRPDNRDLTSRILDNLRNDTRIDRALGISIGYYPQYCHEFTISITTSSSEYRTTKGILDSTKLVRQDIIQVHSSFWKL